jgi:hypothetical protein
MAENSEMELIYNDVLSAWQDAGLEGRRVFDTPGWQDEVDAVKQHCLALGWRASPMGPVSTDTWDHWLHILSHCLEDGHSLAHAKEELFLATLTISTLQNRG